MTRITQLLALRILLVFVGLLGLDQVSKMHAEANLMVWQDEHDKRLYQGRRYAVWAVGSPILNPKKPYLALNMNYVRNQGAAWGTLSAVADKYRIPFFYAVTVLACIVIIVFFLNTPADQLRSRYALILIFAGAIGNFLDRLRLGYVIDWIDVHWNVAGWRYFFPNFNIADVGITVGVLFLLVDIVLAEIKGTRPSVST